jgi:protease-4
MDLSTFNANTWLLDEQTFQKWAALIRHRILFGHDLDGLFSRPHYRPEVKATPLLIEDSEAEAFEHKTEVKTRVAIVPIIGGLTKRGDLCSYGMQDYERILQELDQDPEVDGIVLHIESPGGTVDGTMSLARTVAGLSKPVVAYGETMVASAAYWIASQTDRIISNEVSNTIFGSIGTLMVYQNFQEWLEKEGLEVRIIRAPQSVNKARVNPYEELTEELEADLRAELEAITENFIEAVRAGRGEALNPGETEIFDGSTFTQEQALQLGLIDEIGTLQEAIDYIEIASKKTTQHNQANNMKILERFTSFLSGKAEDEKPELTGEELQQAAEEIQQLKDDHQAVTDQLNESHSMVEALNKKLQERDQQIEALKGIVEGKEQELKDEKADHVLKIQELVKSYEEEAGEEETQELPGEQTEGEDKPNFGMLQDEAEEVLARNKSFSTKPQ